MAARDNDALHLCEEEKGEQAMRELDTHMPPVNVLTTTVGKEEDARRLARDAVSGRLAACVQVEPITSHYVWQGTQCEDAEWRLVFKTLPTGMFALLRWLRSAHPYDLPQILVREEQASREYAAWVEDRLKV